jgi:putative ABC transport system substrate-binding protein
MRRLAFLMSASESDKGYQSLQATFRDELGKLGWVENRNIHFDYRWGAVDAQTRQRLAKELIAIQPDLLLAQSTSSSLVLVIRSVRDSLQACRGQAAMPLASSIWKIQ